MDADATLTEPITQTVIVTNAATATARARVSGTVNVEDGVFVALATVSGTVHVAAGSMAVFADQMSGTLHLASGGSARILPGASALGTMHIDGHLLDEGERGCRCVAPGRSRTVAGSARQTSSARRAR
ncbi:MULTISPECIES: hypothetical protein [unclassified Curtobacterium]|uniref:hypothetical protein n=1 Tax=unclassified Curtobacterium TaxID=257496 RepID=UPI00380C47A6